MIKTVRLSLICLFILLVGNANSQESSASNPTLKREHVESRINFLDKLTAHSSAARQIETSSSIEAKARHRKARALYDEAVTAFNANDLEAATALLKQTVRIMFEAVRLADPEEVLADKRERDFQDRLSSINALIDAHNRVSIEKGASDNNRTLRKLVDRKLALAEELRSNAKLVDGRKALDEAYVAIKVAIESLRGGDTLVRTLNFATKEEEYDYEVDRNDTHRMLVNILLKEKMEGNKGIKDLVQTFMDKAAKTRSEAEDFASKGDYESAVTTMEKSTKEVLRAIRSAGIYIPG